MPVAQAWPVLAPNWFKDTALGIEVEQFIGLAVIILAAASVLIFAVIAADLFMRARVVPENRPFWREEQRRLRNSAGLLALAVAFLVGFPVLDFELDVEDVVDTVARLVASVAVVLLAFRTIDVFSDHIAGRAARTESKLDDQLVPILRSSLKVFVVTIGGLFVLQNLDVNIASLIAGLGIGGLAVALAAQDTIKNVLGGITIFADKPFQVGDWVVLDEIEGTVENVGFRSTRIRTFYNSLITVPNARMTDSAVDNMGLRTWRRYTTTLGLTYQTSPDKVQAFVEGVRAIIRANPKMRTDYYIVELHGFGQSSLDVLLYCFISAPDWNAELRTRHILNLDIMRLAQRLGVEFAFPTQTLHIAGTPERPQAAIPDPAQEQLAAVVDAFGPQGKAGQRVDTPITGGYDNG